MKPLGLLVGSASAALVVAAARLSPWHSEYDERGIPATASSLGLTPTSLAAAGCGAAEASAVLTRLSQQTERLAAYRAASGRLRTAVRAIAVLRAEVQANPADAGGTTELAALIQQSEADRAALATLRHELRQAALDGLAGAKVQQVGAALMPGSHLAPAEYRVLTRTPDEHRSVRLAALAERRAQRTGEEVPAEAEAILDATRENAAVVAAAASLAEKRDAVHTAFANWQ